MFDERSKRTTSRPLSAESWDSTLADLLFSDRFPRGYIVRQGFTKKHARWCHLAAVEIEGYMEEAVAALRQNGMLEYQANCVSDGLRGLSIQIEQLPECARRAEHLKYSILNVPDLAELLKANPLNVLDLKWFVKDLEAHVNTWKPLLDTASLRINFIAIIMAIIGSTVKQVEIPSFDYKVPRYLMFYVYFSLLWWSFKDSYFGSFLGGVVHRRLSSLKKSLSNTLGSEAHWNRIGYKTSVFWEFCRRNFPGFPTCGILVFAWYIILVCWAFAMLMFVLVKGRFTDQSTVNTTLEGGYISVEASEERDTCSNSPLLTQDPTDTVLEKEDVLQISPTESESDTNGE